MTSCKLHSAANIDGTVAGGADPGGLWCRVRTGVSAPGYSVLILFLALALSASAATRIFHVAPAPLGNDSHEGSTDRPFASLERARQAVRAELEHPTSTAGVAVEFAAGVYELPEPMRFSPEDSGRKDLPVVYRAAPGAKVVLSGGRRVTGWQGGADNRFQATVGLGVDFRQLWVNGRRAIRARTPNVGDMATLGAEKEADGFDLPAKLFDGVTLRASEVEMSVLIAWMHKRLRIAKVSPGKDAGTVRAAIAEPEWDGIIKQPQGDRVYLNRHYWLENAPEFLDAPGEFYLDRTRGVLRYQARADENPREAIIVRPELESLIVLEGRPDAPVHDLRFENLEFAYTGWTRPNQFGFVDVQANSLVPVDTTRPDAQYRHNQRKDRVPAAFQAYTADRIVIRGCRFSQLGGTGVMFTHGGDDNVIEGNAFFDLAAGGIEFGEDAARPENPRFFPRRNRIAHNFLAHVGEDYFGSVPILGYYTDASLIEHNEIANVPYTAISQGWGWGSPAAPADSRNNRITHNHVTNYLRRLDDGGGIYTTDRLLGSEIAHNVVSRMLPPDVQTKAGGALYLDQFTEGVLVRDNVVTEAIRWLFIWNANIQRNRVTENVADTSEWRNDGTENKVDAASLLGTGADVTAAAKQIRTEAGIGSAFAHARQFSDERDWYFDTNGPDFYAPVKEWQPAPASSGLVAHAHRSDLPEASARWFPLVPQAGSYEMSLWQPADAAALSVVVRTANSETTHEVPAGSTAGWRKLGVVSFSAGAGSEIVITRSGRDAAPVVLEVLRLVRTASEKRSAK